MLTPCFQPLPAPCPSVGSIYSTVAVHLPQPQRQQWPEGTEACWRDEPGSFEGIAAFAFGKLSTYWRCKIAYEK